MLRVSIIIMRPVRKLQNGSLMCVRVCVSSLAHLLVCSFRMRRFFSRATLSVGTVGLLFA